MKLKLQILSAKSQLTQFENYDKELKYSIKRNSYRWQRLRYIRESIFFEVLIPREMLVAVSIN